jgi:hypothetical protein
MVEIREIDIVGDRSERLREILAKSTEMAHEKLGADLAGFALVTWGMRGEVHTAYCADVGPVAPSFVPFFAMQCLQTHRAVVVSHETASERVTPDETS